MFRKKFAILGISAVLCMNFCSGIAVQAEETAQEEATEETDAQKNADEEKEEANEDTEEEAAIQEGYTETTDSYTRVVSWCKNGENNIYGQFYYPADFDETKTYPTVIMSHGLGSRAEMVERAQWPQKAVQEGYVVYTFDFCGGSINSNSDMDYEDMTVMTEVSDLNAVMDFVEEKSFVDTDQLFLLGQSQGGLVSALTAAERPDEVAAMVLVYPAFCIVDNVHEIYTTAEDIPDGTAEMPGGNVSGEYVKAVYDLDLWETIAKYKGDVLLIHGENDATVPYSYSEVALEKAYTGENSRLILIEGEKSTHGFEMINEEGRDYAESEAMEFLNQHLNTGEE